MYRHDVHTCVHACTHAHTHLLAPHTSTQVEAFELSYLNRVIDVKDTKHKVSLMTHLVELVTEQFSESTDLYSELPHVHRVAKVRAGEQLE